MLSPDFFAAAYWPFADGELRFCAEETHLQAAQGAAVQGLTLRIAAAANIFIPIGQCSDGTVPLPRPFVSTAEAHWRSMSLVPSCTLDIAAVRAFVQAEAEVPRCPGNICSASSACDDDTSWETTDQALCTLGPLGSRVDRYVVPHE